MNHDSDGHRILIDLWKLRGEKKSLAEAAEDMGLRCKPVYNELDIFVIYRSRQ